MGTTVKRASLQSMATLVIAMLLLFNYQDSPFSALKSSNSSGSQCSGSTQQCFVVVGDPNLAVFARPERRLDTPNPGQVGQHAGNRNKSVTDCGKGKPYHGCVPRPNQPKIPEHCLYRENNRNRNC
ncbi:hypothetical protein PTKIN_Ptkin15bG0177000 [Pterospermum kingtungense]